MKKWTSSTWPNYGFMLDNNGSGSIVQIGAQEDPQATAFLYINYQLNQPPSKAVLDEPANNAQISTLTPTLKVQNATDPNPGDVVQYGWVVWDSQWNVKYIKDYAPGQTSITVPTSANLQPGQTYTWTAVTFDGYAYAAWDPWYFTVSDPGVPNSNAVGLEDFYPYKDFPLGQGTAYANMANGNLTVQGADLDVLGQGLNMRLVRTYNANDDASNGVLGRGWRLGIAEGSAGSSGSIDLMQLVNVLWPSRRLPTFVLPTTGSPPSSTRRVTRPTSSTPRTGCPRS